MFAQGNSIKNMSNNSLASKYYTGITTVQVVDINPQEKRINEIYNSIHNLNYNYIGASDEGIKFARIRFCLYMLDNPTTLPLLLEYRIDKCPASSRDKRKIQVIDKYGRTAWGWLEDVNAHVYPLTSTVQSVALNIDESYRVAYKGEEALTNFLRNWLGIKSVKSVARKDGATAQDFDKCICRLDTINSFFNNDFSEITSLLEQKDQSGINYIDHTFNVLLGVKNVSGYPFQIVFNDCVQPSWQSDLSYLESRYNYALSIGKYPSCTFTFDQPCVEFDVSKLKSNNIIDPANVITGDNNTDFIEDLPF